MHVFCYNSFRFLKDYNVKYNVLLLTVFESIDSSIINWEKIEWNDKKNQFCSEFPLVFHFFLEWTTSEIVLLFSLSDSSPSRAPKNKLRGDD